MVRINSEREERVRNFRPTEKIGLAETVVSQTVWAEFENSLGEVKVSLGQIGINTLD